MSGWTMHNRTNRGYEYPAANRGKKDLPKFDKSFMLSGWTGAYFGESATDDRWWFNSAGPGEYENQHEIEKKSRYLSYGESIRNNLVAENKNRKFSWKIGSYTRYYDATRYFYGNMYPAITIRHIDSSVAVKISDIKFGSMQC